MSHHDRWIRVVLAAAVGFAVLAGCMSAPDPVDAPVLDGVQVTGSLPADFAAEQVDTAPGEGLPADAVTATQGYELTPSGPLEGTVTLTFDVGNPPADGDEVVVLTSESATGPWEPLVTTYDPAKGQAAAATTHFSFFMPVWLGGSTLRGAISSIIDGFAGGAADEATPPTCSGTSGYDQQLFGDAFASCTGLVNRGPAVTLVNTRRYPLVINVYSGSATLLDRQFSVASAISDWSQGADYAVVPPGGTIRYRIDGPAGIYARFDSTANSVAALFTGIDLAVKFMTRLGYRDLRAATEIASELTAAPGCADAMGAGAPPNQVIPACFNDYKRLATALGAKGALVSLAMTVGGLASFFRGQLNAFFDSINGRDQVGVLLTPTPAAEPTVTYGSFLGLTVGDSLATASGTLGGYTRSTQDNYGDGGCVFLDDGDNSFQFTAADGLLIGMSGGSDTGTDAGIGVGDTLTQVQAAYPSGQLELVVQASFWAWLVSDPNHPDRWLGFWFSDEPSDGTGPGSTATVDRITSGTEEVARGYEIC